MKQHIQRFSISNCFLHVLVPSNRRRQKYTYILLRHILGHNFLRACIKEVKIITIINVQNSIFIGSVFQIQVSDSLVPSLYIVYNLVCVYLLKVCLDRGTIFWNLCSFRCLKSLSCFHLLWDCSVYKHVVTVIQMFVVCAASFVTFVTSH